MLRSLTLVALVSLMAHPVAAQEGRTPQSEAAPPAPQIEATPPAPQIEGAPEANGAPALTTDEGAVEVPMTLDRLWQVIQAVDPEASRAGTRVQLTVSDVPVLMICDPAADRMRLLVPIRSTQSMTPGELHRVLEANFDTTLDARYAIAQGRLWATYIHPLSPLERAQFLSGLGQTVNIALSYGTSYSGGEMVFMGGDAGARQRALIEELLKKGEEL